MKKLLISALVIALSLSLCIPAFAAESTVSKNGGTQGIDVEAKYIDSVDTPTIYNVDVSWGAMEFTYTVSGTKTWNAETHTYTVSTSDEWTASGNEITVTNHSNTAVKAEFTYEAKNGHNTVTGSFSENTLTLPTAEGKLINDTALVGKTALTLGGTLADTTTNLIQVVGAVTVAISKQ